VLVVRAIGRDQEHRRNLVLLGEERRHAVVVFAAVRADADLEAQRRRAGRIGELQDGSAMPRGHVSDGIGQLDRMAVAPDRKVGRSVCAIDASLLHREDIALIAVAFLAPGAVRVGVAFQPHDPLWKAAGPSVRCDPGDREHRHPGRGGGRTLEDPAPVDQALHAERPLHIAPGQGRHRQRGDDGRERLQPAQLVTQAIL